MSSVNNNISNIAFTRTVLGLLVGVIVLAVDELNPIKLLMHVFPSIYPWHLATTASLAILYVWVSEFKELLYFGLKIFVNSMLSIFFRDIEVLGKDRLPRHGPMIFVINHANQFVDAMVVMGTCTNENFKISYLMAQKSLNRPIIGDVASALDVVPIKRAQDAAIRGQGTIEFKAYVTSARKLPSSPLSPSSSEGDESGVVVVDGKQQDDDGNDGNDGVVDDTNNDTNNSSNINDDNSNDNGNGDDNDKEVVEEDNHHDASLKKLMVHGKDGFTTSAFRVGDKLRPVGTATAVKVLEILDDVTCILDVSTVSENDLATVFSTSDDNKDQGYDILRHVDLHSMFGKVLDRLALGGVFAIFPEGGSHDRTDLLPLKVGVALIAYSALERDGISVPIVPVGLNYFRTHRWRGKCLVEYGDPVFIKPGSLGEYQKGGATKRAVCTDLLDRIKDSMRSVIVTMPDYESLQVVHTARRLYQRNSEAIGGQGKQDLLRRFAVGYKILYSGLEDKPQAWIDLQERIKAYRRELKELGLRDYQVTGLDRENRDEMKENIRTAIRIVYRIVHLLVLTALSALPSLFLNLPVRILADVYAEHCRKKALAASKVKIYGYDVMLTEKLTLCIVLVPLLWLLYGLIMVFFTNFDGQTITLCFMCFPVFSYAAIISSEAGMVDGKDLKPYLLRLLPSTRKRLRALPKQRRDLSNDLRAFVKKVGPAFGELYHRKSVDWTQITNELSENSADIMKKAVSEDGFHHVDDDFEEAEVAADKKDQ
mmetsp:Transcript_21418/g.46773  ORF Transcript_21418/g.46773 Transcript_21418/m.46773 type:complete len:766 (+) Transcript_21418:544-2841(+)|eukprot:CAMPEP_0168203416 /NCGR_PEP_ID=MMETSP0139_2-20121125/24841_1 /TAXON_ID=44445 /ORGANISM="Pseudo-nitzschia australis, Strain 10249 10 AB" /LENGTH=765 /DNA_ID=CAMNT_0008129263 /DNA_START=521 /DNA_END=2818 /DNA_ORIENTATION=-